MPLSPVPRLAVTLTNSSPRRYIPYSLYDPTPDLSPLICLIDNIYFFPLSWRKFIISTCRLQKQILSNKHLSLEYACLEPHDIHMDIMRKDIDSISIPYSCDKAQLLLFLDMITPSTIACSLLSYIARAESSHFFDDFSLQKELAYQKEVNAASNSSPPEQRLKYTGLFGVNRERMHPDITGGIPYPLSEQFKRAISSYIVTFSREDARILLPFYSDKKNVSYQTQRNLLGERFNEYTGVTTLDLLRHYMNTGERITGPMEMRLAWFYNDLKPRIYYTNGGDSYFASLYISSIADTICNILPSTNPNTRYNVTRVGSLNDDQILITYDYTSFTSSLSELQFFLYHLANRFKGTRVDVYDPFMGVVSRDLGDIVHEYNQFVNEHCLVSVERFEKLCESAYIRMGQGGALGAKGNITFSTALHGFALADITSKLTDCVVGDDALSIIALQFLDVFRRAVNVLGFINDDKYSAVLPISVDPLRSTSFKFLKRPLDVDGQHIPTLGELDFFPDIASVLFPEGDGFHTLPPSSTYHSRVTAFISQVSRYSRLVSRHGDGTIYDQIYQEDIMRSLNTFGIVYDRLGLPREGHPPGFSVIDPLTREPHQLRLFIPPLDPELLRVGWLQLCYSVFQGALFEVPELASTIVPPFEVEVGQHFYCTSDIKECTMLYDLGYMERKESKITVRFDEKYKTRLETFLDSKPEENDEHLLYEYYVVKECPHWGDLMSRFQPIEICGREILENVTAVHSVFTD